MPNKIFLSAFTLLSSIIFISPRSQAIEYLPCQRALMGDYFVDPLGKAVKLEPNQVVVKGPFSILMGGTGQEDTAVYDVLDEVLVNDLFGFDRDFEMSLRPGDYVYLYGPDRKIVAYGYHDEPLEPASRPINFPRLKSQPGGEDVIPPQALFEQYWEEPKVVAIVSLPEKKLAFIDEKVKEHLPVLDAHKNDKTRFVSLGSAIVHERKIFEEVIEGTPRVNQAGEVYIEQDNGRPARISGRFRLFAIDAKGLALGELTERQFPLMKHDFAKEVFKSIWRLVMIRPKGDADHFKPLELP